MGRGQNTVDLFTATIGERRGVSDKEKVRALGYDFGATPFATDEVTTVRKLSLIRWLIDNYQSRALPESAPKNPLKRLI